MVVDEQFEFCGQELTFPDNVDTLSCDRSDYEDVENKTKDSIRRANRLLVNFVVLSAVKSCLLQFFCTFFYCAALWRLACHVTLQVQANVFLLQGKHFMKEI